MRKSARGLLAGAIPLLFVPNEAAAHLVSTGMGPVYDGIGHLILTPEDLVPTLAVALFAGLRGPLHARLILFSFPLAWLIGGIIGLQFNYLSSVPVAPFSYIALGLFIAVDLRLAPVLFIFLAALIALAHGYFNGVVLKVGPQLAGLMGISATLFVLLAVGSAVVISLQPPWTRIVVRVLGSWIAAIGLLMIGWLFAGGV